MGWGDLPLSSADIDQIDGDPATLRSCADELQDLALDMTVAWQACNGLGDIADELSWSGEAQQAFMRKVDQNPKGSDIDNIQAAFRDAASAIDTLATKMADAQSTIEWCRGRIDDLDVHVTVSVTDEALGASETDGLPPELVAELESIAADAQAARDDWYAARDEAAETFVALRQNTMYTDAPGGGFWDQALWGFQFQGQGYVDFFVGAWDGIAETAVGAWNLGKWWYTTPGYTLMEKVINDEELLLTLVQLEQYRQENPGAVWEEGSFWNEMGQAVVEWDLLMENPSKWFGKLAPGIVLGVFTGGIGTAAVVAARSGALLTRVGAAALAVARSAASLARPSRLIRLGDNLAGLGTDLMRVNSRLSLLHNNRWGLAVTGFMDEVTAMFLAPVYNAAAASVTAIGTVARNVAGEIVHMTDNLAGVLTGRNHDYELVGAEVMVGDSVHAIDPANLVLTSSLAHGAGPTGTTGPNGSDLAAVGAARTTVDATMPAGGTSAVTPGSVNHAGTTTVDTGSGGSHPLNPGAGSSSGKSLGGPVDGVGSNTTSTTADPKVLGGAGGDDPSHIPGSDTDAPNADDREATPVADGGNDDKAMGEPLDHQGDDLDEDTNGDVGDDRFEEFEKEFPTGQGGDAGPADLADTGTTQAADAEHLAEAEAEVEVAGALGATWSPQATPGGVGPNTPNASPASSTPTNRATGDGADWAGDESGYDDLTPEHTGPATGDGPDWTSDETGYDDLTPEHTGPDSGDGPDWTSDETGWDVTPEHTGPDSGDGPDWASDETGWDVTPEHSGPASGEEHDWDTELGMTQEGGAVHYLDPANPNGENLVTGTGTTTGSDPDLAAWEDELNPDPYSAQSERELAQYEQELDDGSPVPAGSGSDNPRLTEPAGNGSSSSTEREVLVEPAGDDLVSDAELEIAGALVVPPTLRGTGMMPAATPAPTGNPAPSRRTARSGDHASDPNGDAGAQNVPEPEPNAGQAWEHDADGTPPPPSGAGPSDPPTGNPPSTTFGPDPDPDGDRDGEGDADSDEEAADNFWELGGDAYNSTNNQPDPSDWRHGDPSYRPSQTPWEVGDGGTSGQLMGESGWIWTDEPVDQGNFTIPDGDSGDGTSGQLTGDDGWARTGDSADQRHATDAPGESGASDGDRLSPAPYDLGPDDGLGEAWDEMFAPGEADAPAAEATTPPTDADDSAYPFDTTNNTILPGNDDPDFDFRTTTQNGDDTSTDVGIGDDVDDPGAAVPPVDIDSPSDQVIEQLALEARFLEELAHDEMSKLDGIDDSDWDADADELAEIHDIEAETEAELDGEDVDGESSEAPLPEGGDPGEESIDDLLSAFEDPNGNLYYSTFDDPNGEVDAGVAVKNEPWNTNWPADVGDWDAEMHTPTDPAADPDQRPDIDVDETRLQSTIHLLEPSDPVHLDNPGAKYKSDFDHPAGENDDVNLDGNRGSSISAQNRETNGQWESDIRDWDDEASDLPPPWSEYRYQHTPGDLPPGTNNPNAENGPHIESQLFEDRFGDPSKPTGIGRSKGGVPYEIDDGISGSFPDSVPDEWANDAPDANDLGDTSTTTGDGAGGDGPDDDGDALGDHHTGDVDPDDLDQGSGAAVPERDVDGEAPRSADEDGDPAAGDGTEPGDGNDGSTGSDTATAANEGDGPTIRTLGFRSETAAEEAKDALRAIYDALKGPGGKDVDPHEIVFHIDEQWNRSNEEWSDRGHDGGPDEAGGAAVASDGPDDHTDDDSSAASLPEGDSEAEVHQDHDADVDASADEAESTDRGETEPGADGDGGTTDQRASTTTTYVPPNPTRTLYSKMGRAPSWWSDGGGGSDPDGAAQSNGSGGDGPTDNAGNDSDESGIHDDVDGEHRTPLGDAAPEEADAPATTPAGDSPVKPPNSSSTATGADEPDRDDGGNDGDRAGTGGTGWTPPLVPFEEGLRQAFPPRPAHPEWRRGGGPNGENWDLYADDADPQDPRANFTDDQQEYLDEVDAEVDPLPSKPGFAANLAALDGQMEPKLPENPDVPGHSELDDMHNNLDEEIYRIDLYDGSGPTERIPPDVLTDTDGGATDVVPGDDQPDVAPNGRNYLQIIPKDPPPTSPDSGANTSDGSTDSPAHPSGDDREATSASPGSPEADDDAAFERLLGELDPDLDDGDPDGPLGAQDGDGADTPDAELTDPSGDRYWSMAPGDRGNAENDSTIWAQNDKELGEGWEHHFDQWSEGLEPSLPTDPDGPTRPDNRSDGDNGTASSTGDRNPTDTNPDQDGSGASVPEGDTEAETGVPRSTDEGDASAPPHGAGGNSGSGGGQGPSDGGDHLPDATDPSSTDGDGGTSGQLVGESGWVWTNQPVDQGNYSPADGDGGTSGQLIGESGYSWGDGTVDDRPIAADGGGSSGDEEIDTNWEQGRDRFRWSPGGEDSRGGQREPFWHNDLDGFPWDDLPDSDGHTSDGNGGGGGETAPEGDQPEQDWDYEGMWDSDLNGAEEMFGDPDTYENLTRLVDPADRPDGGFDLASDTAGGTAETEVAPSSPDDGVGSNPSPECADREIPRMSQADPTGSDPIPTDIPGIHSAIEERTGVPVTTSVASPRRSLDDEPCPAWVDEEFPWLGEINPNIDRSIGDVGTSGTRNNCISSSIAVDRRLAGDTTAVAAVNDPAPPPSWLRDAHDPNVGPTQSTLWGMERVRWETGRPVQWTRGTPQTVREAIQRYLLARADLPWTGRPRGIVFGISPAGAHVWNVTLDSNGHVRFVDGQTGREAIFDHLWTDPDGTPYETFGFMDTTDVSYDVDANGGRVAPYRAGNSVPPGGPFDGCNVAGPASSPMAGGAPASAMGPDSGGVDNRPGVTAPDPESGSHTGPIRQASSLVVRGHPTADQRRAVERAAADALARELQQRTFGPGCTIAVGNVDVRDSLTIVTLKIFHDGNPDPVGELIWELSTEGGSVHVTYRNLKLDEGLHHQGTATELTGALETWFREFGVVSVRVFASKDGGYVWALLDFNWAPGAEAEARTILRKLQGELRSLTVTDAERAAALDILDRAEKLPWGHDRFPTVGEIARLGYAEHHGDHLGQRVLVGEHWHGQKVLADGDSDTTPATGEPDGGNAVPAGIDDVPRPDWVADEFPWLRNVNPTGDEHNCQQCALATDQRLGGDDNAVAPPGGLVDSHWIEQQTGRESELLGRDPVEARSLIDARMLSHHANPDVDTPKGIVLGWRQGPDGHLVNSHAWNVTVDSTGTVRYIDGQTGREAFFDTYLPWDQGGSPFVRFDFIDTSTRRGGPGFDGPGDTASPDGGVPASADETTRPLVGELVFDRAPSPEEQRAVESAVRTVFEGQTFGRRGCTIDPVEVLVQKNTTRITATVMHERRPVGQMIRALHRTNGQLTAQYLHLNLRVRELRGQGFATDLHRFHMDWFAESGVFKVSATASGGEGNNGGYTLAILGFKWAQEHTARHVLGRLRSEMTFADLTDGERAAAQDILDRADRLSFDDDRFPTPEEIANIGRLEHPGEHFGRRFLNDVTWICEIRVSGPRSAGDPGATVWWNGDDRWFHQVGLHSAGPAVGLPEADRPAVVPPKSSLGLHADDGSPTPNYVPPREPGGMSANELDLHRRVPRPGNDNHKDLATLWIPGQKLISRPTSRAFYVTFEDDSHAVDKPISMERRLDDHGQPLRSSIQQGTYADRAVATSRVFEDAGVEHLVATTTYAEGRHGRGSRQEWLQGNTSPFRSVRDYRLDDGQNMAVGMLVVGATDQHTANIVTHKGRPAGVDLDLNFPEDASEPIKCPFVWEYHEGRYRYPLLESVRRAWSFPLAQLRQTLEDCNIPEPAILLALAELEAVQRTGRITSDAWPGEIWPGSAWSF